MKISSGNKDHFEALTGLRAILAIGIYLNHFNHFTNRVLYNMVHEDYVVLPGFFLLSGFLITYRYYDSGPIDFRKYLVNRVARIYPMYFLLTTFSFIMFAILYQQRTTNDLLIYIMNISFLRGFFDNLKFTGIAQGWSLTVEETFYFMAPLLFFFLRKSRYFLLWLPVLLFTVGLLLVRLSSMLSLGSFFKDDYFMFAYTFFGRVVDFFAGIALAFFLQRFGKTYHTRFATYIGLFIILLSIAGLAVVRNVYHVDSGVQHPVGMIVHSMLLPIFGIAVFYWGLIREKTTISRLLSTRLFMLLGRSSYVFYLIHLGIFHTLLEYLPGNEFIHFLLLEGLAVVLFTLIEEPLNLYLRRALLKSNNTYAAQPMQHHTVS